MMTVDAVSQTVHSWINAWVAGRPKTVRSVVNTCHSERFRGEFSRKGDIQMSCLQLLCLSVYRLVFSHNISETNTARVSKLDTAIIHDESWKYIYFGVKRSKVKVTSHKKTLPAWPLASLCTVVSTYIHSYIHIRLLLFGSHKLD